MPDADTIISYCLPKKESEPMMLNRCRFGLLFFSVIAPLANAANGDLVATVHFSVTCTSGFQGLGVGIAFDGANLWYSCYQASPDLYRANPRTGQVTAAYTIAGGIGALAYDAKRNALWGGWSTRSPGQDRKSVV